MSARFAGSRSLDDRRRRRLATEAGDEVKSTAKRAGQSKTRQQPEEEPHLQITHFPLRKLISHRRWKIWAVLTAMFAINAGVLWGATKFGPEAINFGPNVVRLIDLQTGRLPSLLFAGCLFLAAELSVFIYWIRSRSPKDFNGSFRVWFWASSAFFVFGCVAASQAHLVWSQVVCRFWAAQFPNRATWCWLVPIAGVNVPIFVRLLRDMRASRTSCAFFLLAVACCFASIGWQFDLWAWPTKPETQVLAEAVALVLTGWAILGAMLHHARHVLHVSTDPPEVLLKARAEKRTEKKANASKDQAESPPGWWAERKMRREAHRVERESQREQQRQEKADRLAEKERLNAEQKAAAEQAKAEKSAAKEQARLDAIAAKEEAKANAEAARKAEKEARSAAKAEAKTKAAKQPDPPVTKTEPEPKSQLVPEDVKSTAGTRDDLNSRSTQVPKQQSKASQPQSQNTQQLRTASGEPFDPSKPLTDDMLRGLSKSQKRKLRKAHREAQRQDSAA